MPDSRYLRPLAVLGPTDVPDLGARVALLGALARLAPDAGLNVPGGFALTRHAYDAFLDQNDLRTPLAERLAALGRGEATRETTARTARHLFRGAVLPIALAEAVREAYRVLAKGAGQPEPDVAVRVRYAGAHTSDTLPPSLLGVRGEDELLDAVRACYTAFYSPRTLASRSPKALAEDPASRLALVIQPMVRADRAGAGLLYTSLPDDHDTVLVTAAWGLGGTVTYAFAEPDRYRLSKAALAEGRRGLVQQTRGSKGCALVYGEDGLSRTVLVPTSDEQRNALVLRPAELDALGRAAVLVERHARRPLRLEWAKDGLTKHLFLVDARPLMEGEPLDIDSTPSEDVAATPAPGDGAMPLHLPAMARATAAGSSPS